MLSLINNDKTSCYRCHNKDGLNYITCQKCNNKFCEMCNNTLYSISDVKADAYVCKNHSEICLHTGNLFARSYQVCYSNFYMIDSYKCDFALCENYTCDTILNYMKSEGNKLLRSSDNKEENKTKSKAKVSKVCHDHLTKCLSCRKLIPMVGCEQLKLKGKTNYFCFMCYDKFMTYIKCITLHCINTNNSNKFLIKEFTMLLLLSINFSFKSNVTNPIKIN